MQTEVRSNIDHPIQLVNNGGVYRKYIKRPMDFILSLIAIIVLAPVLLIIAILVRIKLGSPVLFKQKRPGLNEKIFTLYKFRTMTDERDENGELLPDEIRLTRFGKLLRSTSLDELPEIFNIIKGDMSIVGPRPQLVRDMVYMTPEQRRRHDIRPGLSGWAQINGRNAIEWEDKLNYDLEYLDTVSFWLDAKIVLVTIKKVFKTESISYEGMATAEDFGDYLLRTGKTSQEQYNEGREEAKELLKFQG
jgi:undecaprenyl phosphate N,N'-diacetylbacillosamine 1-phosphate transferase